MNERRTHLKIKIKTHTAEARIIKAEERRAPLESRNSLTYHRRRHLRPITRRSNLAYAILNGTPYSRVEQSAKEPVNFKKVAKEAENFGAELGAITDWVIDAKKHIGDNPLLYKRMH